MLVHSNNSNTAIIVLHEIYGINQHMRNICEKIAETKFDVYCPNLLDSIKLFDYNEEDIAYQYFMDNVGFEKALDKVKKIAFELEKYYKHLFIIGYSVGATIAWLCSEEKIYDGIISYYGSRIRDYRQVVPKCPSLLYFSSEEKSFYLPRLIKDLNNKDNTITFKYNGKHGFSDPYSINYCQQSYEASFNRMIRFINHCTEEARVHRGF